MFFSTLLSVSLLAFGTVAAASHIKRDTCTYAYEPQLFAITSQTPQSSTGEFTSPFLVWQQDGNTDLVASFRTVPGGAYGCNLQLDYEPANNPISQLLFGDPTVINVFQISDGGNFPRPINWENTATRTGDLVGTFRFPSGDKAGSPQTVWINSFTCSPVMTYRFSIANPNAIGGVQIEDTPTSGLRMAYNC